MEKIYLFCSVSCVYKTSMGSGVEVYQTEFEYFCISTGHRGDIPGSDLYDFTALFTIVVK